MFLPIVTNKISCEIHRISLGTVAAVAGNGQGVVGVIPNVKLYIVRVFADSCGWAYSSDLIDALNRCTDVGAKIVSMSLGGGGSSTTEKNAFDAAYNNGVLSIAAAGNCWQYGPFLSCVL